MERELKLEINRTIAGMECPKGFACCESGFEELCQTKDLGLEEFADCLADNPAACGFALSFGRGHLCRCRLGVYIAKKRRKRTDR